MFKIMGWTAVASCASGNRSTLQTVKKMRSGIKAITDRLNIPQLSCTSSRGLTPRQLVRFSRSCSFEVGTSAPDAVRLGFEVCVLAQQLRLLRLQQLAARLDFGVCALARQPCMLRLQHRFSVSPARAASWGGWRRDPCSCACSFDLPNGRCSAPAVL